MLVLYVQRSVPEPVRRDAGEASASPLLGIFQPNLLRMTLISCLLAGGAHGGYYALTTFLPTYLSKTRHLSVLHTSVYLAVIIVAFFFGCLASAALIDRIGRRRNIALFALCSAIAAALYLLVPLDNAEMLVMGFPLGFFAAGIPSSMGALFSELFPAGTRGTGVGFCYNFGRVIASFFRSWWVPSARRFRLARQSAFRRLRAICSWCWQWRCCRRLGTSRLPKPRRRPPTDQTRERGCRAIG